MAKKFKIIGIKMNDMSYTYIYISGVAFIKFLKKHYLTLLHHLYFFYQKISRHIYEYIEEILY